jgi:hypothetical protein
MQIVFEDSNWRIEKTSNGDIKITSKRFNPMPSFMSEVGEEGIILSCPFLSRLHLPQIAVVGEV